MIRSSKWILAATIASLVGCKGEAGPSAEKGGSTPPAASPGQKAASAPSQAEGAKPAAAANPLMNPGQATAKAPATYAVKLETTKGDIILDVTSAWAPVGADRFYNLVKTGFYDDVAFFRVIGGFMAQVGMHGDPKVNQAWRSARISDDPVKESNKRGMVTFATSGPNSRTTQFFINFQDNSRLDGMGFAPFAKVRDMAVVDKLYAKYGEGAPRGRGPSQGTIAQRGNAYLKEQFPELDYIKKATILED